MAMKRSEIIETVIILFSIVSLMPLVWWYGSDHLYKIPEIYITLYKVLLGILAVVLAVILVRRTKRIKKAMRDAKRQQGKTRKFPPFF